MDRQGRGRRETAALVFVAVSTACVLQPATRWEPTSAEEDRAELASRATSDPAAAGDASIPALPDRGASDLPAAALKDLSRVPSTIGPRFAGGGRRALFGCGSDWC